MLSLNGQDFLSSFIEKSQKYIYFFKVIFVFRVFNQAGDSGLILKDLILPAPSDI